MPILRPLISMMRPLSLAVLTAVSVLGQPVGLALAADPKELGTFGEWTAYTFTEGKGKVCYMATQPSKSEGDYTQRGDVFFLVTHRPAEKANNVISIVSGYPYKVKSEVELVLGKKSWRLFTQGERAWAVDEKTDSDIANGMRKGPSIVAKGVSTKGTTTADTFSLKGYGPAYDAINKECGVGK